MSTYSLPSSAGLALLLAAPVAAQLTVGPAGSGATFDQITDALAVAAVGDTILVAPGSYDAFVVSQGVSIVGAGSGRTELVLPSGSTDGFVDVVGVPAGQTVRISGFALSSMHSSPDGAIELVQCAGRVELVDLVRVGPTFGVPRYVDEPTVRATDCAAVLIDGCHLRGNGPDFALSWHPATHALVLENSAAWITGSRLEGGGGYEGNGAEAVSAEAGSFLHVTSTELLGGLGGAHFGFYWWDVYGWAGQEGLVLEDSEVVLAGGPGNVCRGADGYPLSTDDWTGGGAAVEVLNDAVLRYASDVVLVPGMHGDGVTSNIPIYDFGQGSQVIAEADSRPTLGFDVPAATPGQGIQLRTTGEPGATHLVYFAFDAIAPIGLPGGQSIHVNPFTAVALPPLALDATGATALPVQVPPNAALAGLELVLQAIAVNPGALELSNPALATIVN